MTAGPVLERTDDPPREAYLQLWEILKAFNVKAVGHCESEDFALLLRDPDTGSLVGGLWGRSLWGSFYVDMLVAPDGARGQGLGSDLLTQACEEARRRGCTTIWLDTFAFQARPFYERHGFRVFGQLEGQAPMFPRYFMVRDLDPSN